MADSAQGKVNKMRHVNRFTFQIQVYILELDFFILFFFTCQGLVQVLNEFSFFTDLF